jgi:uncharacterized protein
MSVLRNTFRRWPLVSFFALAYLFSWWASPLHVGGFPLFPFGPDAAVLVIVSVTVGRAGVRRVLGSLTRWGAAPRWYALALLLPLAVTLLAVYAMRWWGAPQSAMPGVVAFLSYLVVLPLATIIGGPLGEELGFRGYALPLLQRRHTALVAVGILCVGHAIWHLPLFFAADPPPVGAFLLGLLAGGVVLAWLMNCTGNIVLVMLLHGGFNTAQQQFMEGFTGADSAHVQLLTAIGWTVAAAIVIWRTHGTLAPAGGSRYGTTPLHEVVSPKRVKAAPETVAV